MGISCGRLRNRRGTRWRSSARNGAESIRGSESAGYQLQTARIDGTGAPSTASDTTLALAWLYGDVVHADPERRAAAGDFPVAERYRSAAYAIARVTVLAMNILGFILHLQQQSVLHLADAVFQEKVVVDDPDRDEIADVYIGDLGTAMPSSPLTDLEPRWQRLATPPQPDEPPEPVS